jgi:hypothetical protein
MNNTGSFGAAIGGGQSIKDAMARRGLGGGATSAVSPSAPTFDPSTQPSALPTGQAPGMPSGGTTTPQAMAPTAPQAPMTPMGTAPTNDEPSLIVKALSERLKALSQLQSGGMA